LHLLITSADLTQPGDRYRKERLDLPWLAKSVHWHMLPISRIGTGRYPHGQALTHTLFCLVVLDHSQTQGFELPSQLVIVRAYDCQGVGQHGYEIMRCRYAHQLPGRERMKQLVAAKPLTGAGCERFNPIDEKY
jgi:hypothetical protein